MRHQVRQTTSPRPAPARSLLLCLSLLLPLPACAGTTVAERIPVAAETVSSVLDDIDRDLTAAMRDFDEMKLPASARAMVLVEYTGLARRIASARADLREAEAEVDPRAFRQAAEQVEILGQLVGGFRNTILIAEAAASGKSS